jgi:hypothetical protein
MRIRSTSLPPALSRLSKGGDDGGRRRVLLAARVRIVLKADMRGGETKEPPLPLACSALACRSHGLAVLLGS